MPMAYNPGCEVAGMTAYHWRVVREGFACFFGGSKHRKSGHLQTLYSLRLSSWLLLPKDDVHGLPELLLFCHTRGMLIDQSAQEFACPLAAWWTELLQGLYGFMV
jgi:hypothetical protein